MSLISENSGQLRARLHDANGQAASCPVRMILWIKHGRSGGNRSWTPHPKYHPNQRHFLGRKLRYELLEPLGAGAAGRWNRWALEPLGAGAAGRWSRCLMPTADVM